MKHGLGWTSIICAFACTTDPPPAEDDGSSTTTSPASDSSSSSSSTSGEPDTSTTITLDTTATEASSDTSTTTGPPTSCTSDDECSDPATPFCSPVLQECVSCTGMPDPQEACTSVDPALPACEDGVCVQCTAEVATQCDGETPVCDETTNACVPCTAHEQCGEVACNLFTGACVEGPVVTVGPAGQDHENLSDAVTSLLPGGGGTIIVQQGQYDEPVDVGGGAIIAILANDGDQPIWQRTLGAPSPQLEVTGGATVLLEGLVLRLNTSDASPVLYTDGGALWVDRAVIAQNEGLSLSAQNTSDVVLRNCFVGGAVDTPVLSISNSVIDVQYSTIGAATGDSTAILCDGGSAVDVSDSIVVSRGVGPEVDCPTLVADHTAFNSMPPAGAGNVEVGPTMTAWFTTYNTGDFHLTPGAGVPTFMGIAEWNQGDPTVDIDDELRANADFAAEPAGADLP